MDAGIWHELIERTFADPAGESFAQTLALHVDPGFLLIDTQGYCLYANQAMQDMTGYSAAEFTARPVHDLIHHHHPDGTSFPREECALHKAIIAGSAFDPHRESLFYRKDGSAFHAFCRIEPVRNAGKLLCMVMELRDIAYLREAAVKKFGAELTYRLAVDLADIGTWERDLKTDLVKQSSKTSEILGLGQEQTEYPARELLQFIVPEDRKPFGQALQEAIARQEPFDLMFRIRRPDGAIRWVATRGTSVKDASGNAVRVAGVMFDVTSQKERDEARHAATLSYQLAIEAANIGTWELEFADGKSTLSPISRTILGLPADQDSLLKNEWQAMIHPEDRELVARVQDAAVRSGDAFQLEFRLIRPDGKMIWVASRGIVNKDEHGRPCKAIGIMIDMTEKKDAEESLRQSTHRLSLILESSSEGIYGIEADHHCTFINRAGAAMLGYEPDEMIGQPVDRMLHGRSETGIASDKEYKLIHAINEGKVMRIEDDVFWRKDGSCFPVAYSVSPIFFEGKPHGAVIVFTDITQRKRMQERERRLAAEARAAAALNAKFRTFFERGINFSGVLNVDGTLVEVNHLALAACGYTREEVVGKKFWECGWWNRSPAVMDIVKSGCEQARSGHLFRRELPYFLANGEERVTDLTLAPVVDDHGEVLYIAPTGSDITERKRAEEALKASEARFRVMAEFSPDAILVKVEDRFVYANPSAARLFGVPDISHILGHKAYDFLDPACHARLRNHLDTVVRLNQQMAFLDLELRRPDGSIAYVQVSSGKVFWENQPAVQCMLRDMTEFKQMQDRLRQTSERLQLAIEGSGEGIWDWDIVNNRFTFSGGLNRILGRTDSDVYSEANEWRKAVHPDDYGRVMAAFQDAVEEKTPLYECEYRLRTRDGNWKWIWARGLIVERDEQGKPLTMTGTLSDITARKESDELAWRHANLDPLTGLPNRRLFRERLEVEVLKLKRSHHQLAVLFIDLDGFKQVNDLYGHDAGDLLLMEAARRLRCCVRETDTIARLGGDEFTIILAELSYPDHVEFVCQKILASLAEPFRLGKDTGYISGSIGVSLYPLDATTPDDLIRKADQAMYAAKHTGKNQFNYFTKEMDDLAHARLHITNELRRALREDQLEVHYQPVIDLKTGQIVKAEALLRWHHPVLGNIEPAQFIPMAEESGLISQIGNWVFKEATVCCKQCMVRAGVPFQIGVNKSPIQFVARDADTNWLDFLSEQDLPPHSISVEITEGVLLQATEKVEDRLMQFREAGVEVALDDFGTGYSSMAYLQKFHIDYVKIDQSFVQNITADPNSLTIAETIIMMAHKLGQKVIAEGIETQEQLDYLSRAGCDYGQGFLFSYPVPSDSLIALVAGQSLSRPN